MPHGVLFRGGEEREVHRQFIERGVLKAVIGLPADLFYGTGIPASILVLNKAGACPMPRSWPKTATATSAAMVRLRRMWPGTRACCSGTPSSWRSCRAGGRRTCR